MTANVIVTVERQFDFPREQVFRAWTEPSQLVHWRGSPGWQVEADSVTGEQKLGGRHFHVKVRESDPGTRVGTNGVYTEFFDPDVFVSRERITGDPGIDPDVPLDLRVEFSQTGRDGTLLRIIQGPYEPDVARWHGEACEKELVRLPDATAQERAADLIVLGAVHDRSLADRLLGTVAIEVTKRATCDVLVVRPADDRGDLEVPEDAPPG